VFTLAARSFVFGVAPVLAIQRGRHTARLAGLRGTGDLSCDGHPGPPDRVVLYIHILWTALVNLPIGKQGPQGR